MGVAAPRPGAGQRQGPDPGSAQRGPRSSAQDARAPGPDPHRHEADRRGHAPQVSGRPVPQGAHHPAGPRLSRRYAVESGMITLRQSGFRQAARGQTTLDEVLTVAMDAACFGAGLRSSRRPMSAPANPPYRVSLRLYVVFSLLMAVSAALSGLFLLYLARPFARALSSEQTRELTVLLFTGSAVAGALAAVGGLIVGLNFAGRIRGIVEKAEALSPRLEGVNGRPRKVTTVRDEIGALDAAVGRLTLSM